MSMIKLRTIKIKNIDFSVSLKTKIITLFIFISSLLNAATITSNYTGNWSSSATWVGGVVPGATDNVIIASNHVVTVNGTYSCANLTIGSNGSSPTLRVTVAANSLTINGILTMNAGNFNGTYTLDAGPGTVNINGTVSWASTSGTNLIETTSSGTLNFGSAITISKSSQNIKVTASGGTVKFNADVTDQQNKISIVAGASSYFAGSYTVNTTATTLFASTSNTYFTGSGKSLVTDAAVTFGHCFIDANASVSTSGSSNITVAGNFELASGSIFTLGNNLYVKLNWTNNGGTLAGGHNHVYLTASNSTIRNINGPYLTTFPNLHIGTPSGSWAVKYNLNTDMTCASLTLENNGSNTSYLLHTAAYNVNVTGDATIKQLTANKTNSWQINDGTATVGGNLIFSGTSNSTSRIAQLIVTTGAFTLSGNVTFMNNTSVATEIISVTSGTLTFQSPLSMPQGSGTLKITNTGVINFNGSSPSYSLNATGSGSNAVFTTTAGCYLNFANGITNDNVSLIIKNGCYSTFTAYSTVTPTAAITFGYININAGATLALAGNITVTNDWLNNGGTFLPSTNTVSFTPSANATQTITKAGEEIFYGLTANVSTATLQLNSDVTVTSSLNMSGHTFNLNAKTLTLGSTSAGTLGISGITTTKGFAYGGTFKRYLAAGITVNATSSPYNGLFPIGIAGDYRPVKINSTVSPSVGGFISMSLTDPGTVTDVSYVDNQGASIYRIADQVFSIRNSGITGGTYNLDVTFNGFSNPGSAAYADYRLITYTGSVLGSAGSNVVPTSNTLLNPVVKRAGLTITNLNNDFVCGTINTTNTPLQQVFFSRTNAGSPTNLNWNATSTWSTTSATGTSCGCTPSSSGYVVISSGTTVHVNSNSTVDKIEIKNGAILDGTSNLTVTNFITLNGSAIIAPTSGTWSITGNLSLSGTGASSSGASLNISNDLIVASTASLTMDAALKVSGNMEINSTLAMGSNTLTLNGSAAEIRGNGTLTGNGTISITNDKTIATGSNLVFSPAVSISSGATVTNQGNVTFNDNVTGTNNFSVFVNGTNGTATINGAFLSSGTLDASAVPNTMNYSANGAQTIKKPSSSYYNLTCSNTGTKSMSASFTVDNLLSIQGSAVLDELTNIISGDGDLNMTSGTPELKMQRSGTTSSPELTGVYTLTTGTVTINQTSGTNSIHDASYYNLKFTGSASYDMTDVDLISHDFSLSGSSVWTNSSGNQLTVNDSLIYSSSGNSTLTGDVDAAIVKITSGTLSDGGNTLNLTSGDWIRNGGTFTATGEVKFSGALLQSITGNVSTTFNNLTVSKGGTSSLTLTKPATVNGALSLINGVINTSSTSLLTLSSTATTGKGTASSYVNGPMAYIMANNGTSTLNFPIGKSGDWRPVVITPTHNTATAYTYTSELFNASAKALNWTLPASINRVSDIHYWDINRSSASAGLVSAVVELSYNNVSGSNDQVTDFSNLTIAKAPTTGSAWTDISGSASGNSSGIVTSGTFNSFSRFAIANKSSGLNPLPIELLNFEVTPKESVVELVWSTASETNNDYFSIERTRDGINFEEIGRIKGAGNSTYLLNYVTTDNAPFQGISYYRLKQTDFDGKFSYSGLKKVEFKSNPDISFNVYPNPSEGEEINIDFTTDQDEELIIEMRDLNGKTIYSLSMIVDQGNNKHTIYLTNRLAKGTYIITTNTLHGLHLYSKQIIVD